MSRRGLHRTANFQRWIKVTGYAAPSLYDMRNDCCFAGYCELLAFGASQRGGFLTVERCFLGTILDAGSLKMGNDRPYEQVKMRS